MLEPNVINLLDTITCRLNAVQSGITIENIESEDTYEYSVSVDGYPRLIFLVEKNNLRVLLGGELYSPIVENYSWDSKVELLRSLLSLLYSVFSAVMSLPTFLGLVVGRKVRNWANFITFLSEGLDLEIYKEGNTLKIKDYIIRVDSDDVTFSGVVEVRKSYEDAFDLILCILSFYQTILEVDDLDIVLFDKDDTALVPGIPEEPGTSAPSSAPDINNDIDLDFDVPEEAPAEEPSPTEDIDLEGIDLGEGE